MRLILILVAVALFITVGLPFWADFCTTAAVAAWRHGLIRAEYAPDLGHGMVFAPILVLIALAAGYWLPRLLKEAMH